MSKKIKIIIVLTITLVIAVLYFQMPEKENVVYIKKEDKKQENIFVKGETLFRKNQCNSCHYIGMDLVSTAPALGGITKKRKKIMEMFEKASKQKLRYKVTSGTISTEDLWDLDLDSLDLLAKTLNKAIKDSEEESFIKSKSTANTTLELKFEIVKHVIEVKLQLEDERKSAKEKAFG